MAYGMTGHLGISYQLSGGTSNVTSLEYFPILNESIKEGINIIESETLKGRFDEGDYYEGAHTIAGDISMELHPILIGKVLKALCNHASGTLAGSVWTHKFVPAQTDWDAKYALPPVTAAVYRDTGSAFVYSSLNVSDLTVEVAQGAILSAAISVVGGESSKVAAGTATYAAGSSFIWDQCSISFGATGITTISQLSIKLAQNLEPKSTINLSKYPNRIKRSGMRSVEISGTILFDDQVEAEKFRAFTSQRFAMYATGQTLSTSQTAAFGIVVPTMIYTDFSPALNGPGQIEVSFTAKGKYNTGSATMIEYTLVNTRDSY